MNEKTNFNGAIQIIQPLVHGNPIPLNDTPYVLKTARQAWSSENAQTAALTLLADTRFWDMNLTTIPGLVHNVVAHLQQFEHQEKIVS